MAGGQLTGAIEGALALALAFIAATLVDVVGRCVFDDAALGADEAPCTADKEGLKALVAGRQG